MTIYASRTVIKNKYYNCNVGSGFYGVDVWAEADNIVRPCLAKGAAYYEIIGFLPNGKYISNKNMIYGCTPPKDGEISILQNKHFKVKNLQCHIY